MVATSKVLRARARTRIGAERDLIVLCTWLCVCIYVCVCVFVCDAAAAAHFLCQTLFCGRWWWKYAMHACTVADLQHSLHSTVRLIAPAHDNRSRPHAFCVIFMRLLSRSLSDPHRHHRQTCNIAYRNIERANTIQYNIGLILFTYHRCCTDGDPLESVHDVLRVWTRDCITCLFVTGFTVHWINSWYHVGFIYLTVQDIIVRFQLFRNWTHFDNVISILRKY